MINPHSLIVTGEQIDILKSKNADLEARLKVAENEMKQIIETRHGKYSKEAKLQLIGNTALNALNKIRGE